MTTFIELTDAGLKSLNFNGIKEGLRNDVSSKWGRVPSETSAPINQIIELHAARYAQIFETFQNVYSSQYPSSASGNSLRLSIGINGLEPQGAEPTRVDCVLTGDLNANIAENSQVQNSENGDIYENRDEIILNQTELFGVDLTLSVVEVGDYTITIDDVAYTYTSVSGDTESDILTGLKTELDSQAAPVDVSISDSTLELRQKDGEARFKVELTDNLDVEVIQKYSEFINVETGSRDAFAGDVNTIITPETGWDAVTNPEDGVLGRNPETEEEMRARQKRSTSLPGQSTDEAITANLLEIEGVIDAKTLKNDTNTTDSLGIPPHTIWAIVQGGEQQEIAEVIHVQKAGGIDSRGDISNQVLSKKNNIFYTVRFDRPSDIIIYAEITIEKLDNYPVDGDEQIKEAVSDYVNSTGLGALLKRTRLYGPIYDNVTGVIPVGMEIGTSPGDLTLDEIQAAPNERIILTPANITITEAP